MPAAGRYFELLRTYVGPRFGQAALLGTLLLGSIGLEIVSPQLLRHFIDQALAGNAIETLVRTAAAFIVIALLTQLLSASAQYVGESLGWAATNELRADLALHVLWLDMGFHKARTAGELIERIDGDVTALGGFFSRFVVNVVGSLVLLVGVLVVVAAEDLRAGAALAAFAVLTLLAFARVRTVAVANWRRVREVSAQLYGSIGEHLAGTEDIRSSGAEAHALRSLGRHHAAWLHARRAAMLSVAVITSTTILAFAIGTALSFGVGTYLWSAGAISLGTVYLLFHYTQLLRRPLEQLRHEVEEMQRAVASIARVDELLRTSSRVEEGRGVPLPEGPLLVELRDVSFAYDDRRERARADEVDGEGDDLVLRGMSLRLEPGRVLGLLGRTGSGKTTLARLLLRFYDATAGSIRLGGLDVRDAALGEVRRRATLVTQDVQLFHASVRDNVTFFDPSVDEAAIRSVLIEIGLGEWLRAVAQEARDPLDAELLSDALSAGEAQLLAFARVFLRDPGLVILDEASSRLDPATERQIERAIDRLFLGRTGIVIAHRLATVQRCDEILILDQGRILEHGPRAVLAADATSHFSRLLRSGIDDVLA
ncbi:MAG: ABC transporter ATP-binding protein [Candidatus Limnocylindria bacterium]